MKKSYYIGWMSEDWGSDCASYSISDGTFGNYNYRDAISKFNELIESMKYDELILFDDSDKIIKSWSNY